MENDKQVHKNFP